VCLVIIWGNILILWCRPGLWIHHHSKKPPYCWRLFALSLALIPRGRGSEAAAGQAKGSMEISNFIKCLISDRIVDFFIYFSAVCFQVTAYLHKDYNNVWLVHRPDNNACEKMHFCLLSSDIGVIHFIRKSRTSLLLFLISTAQPGTADLVRHGDIIRLEHKE